MSVRNNVVIHSDSGTASTLYARAAGLIESLFPGTEAVDASQNFEKGNIPQVSAYLFTTVPFWPDGTVFLSLCGSGDPVAVYLESGSVIISPNNGTATMCTGAFGMREVRMVDVSRYGSDEWAIVRCAAAVAAGAGPDEVGRPAADGEAVFLSVPKARISKGLAEGEIGMVLRTFGNLTFTIGTDEFEDTGIRHGDPVRVTITRGGDVLYREDMTFQPSFGYVPLGEPVVFNGSSGYMDIGLNMKSFVELCLPQVLDAEDLSEFKVRIELI